jgi:hypothetical protein
MIFMWSPVPQALLIALHAGQREVLRSNQRTSIAGPAETTDNTTNIIEQECCKPESSEQSRAATKTLGVLITQFS